MSEIELTEAQLKEKDRLFKERQEAFLKAYQELSDRHKLQFVPTIQYLLHRIEPTITIIEKVDKETKDNKSQV